MKITKQWLKKHGACNTGIKAFCKQKETDSDKILKLLIRSNEKEKLDWANWLITRLFRNKKQRVQYAVFATRLVLPIFEEKYPNDSRLREAIEATERWLKNPSKKNKELYRKASASASALTSVVTFVYSASASVHSASYSASASDSAYSASASASYFTSYSASVSASASAVSYNETMIKIVNYGINLIK